jgi:hypothetical protein
LQSKVGEKGMKLGRIIVWALVVPMMGCTSSQSSIERTAETQKAVAEALASKHLRINISQMHPARYSSRTVSYGFYLELKGDTLESCLPYMGQVHQAAPIEQEGLNFDAPIINYRETRPKKNMTRIELNVRTKEDLFYYLIEIYDSGSAYIRVRGQNRDSISFDGELH